MDLNERFDGALSGGPTHRLIVDRLVIGRPGPPACAGTAAAWRRALGAAGAHPAEGPSRVSMRAVGRTPPQAPWAGLDSPPGRNRAFTSAAYGPRVLHRLALGPLRPP